MRVCKRGRGGSPRSAPIAVAKPRLVFPGAPGKEEEMTGLLKKLNELGLWGIANSVGELLLTRAMSHCRVCDTPGETLIIP